MVLGEVNIGLSDAGRHALGWDDGISGCIRLLESRGAISGGESQLGGGEKGGIWGLSLPY